MQAGFNFYLGDEFENLAGNYYLVSCSGNDEN